MEKDKKPEKKNIEEKSAKSADTGSQGSSKLVPLVIISLVVLLLCCLMIAGIYLVFNDFGRQITIPEPDVVTDITDQKDDDTDDKPDDIVATPTTEPGVYQSLPATNVSQSDAKSLKRGTLYLGMKNGEYYSFTRTVGYDYVSVSKEANIKGQNSANENIEFSQLTNRVVILPGDGKATHYSSGFVVFGNKAYISVSRAEKLPGSDYESSVWDIIEFNLDTHEKRVIYTKAGLYDYITNKLTRNKISTPSQNGGLNIVGSAGEKYIVVRVPACYACDEIPPGHVLLINTETGKDIFIDSDASAFKFNLNAGELKFQNVVFDSSICEGATEYCLGEYVPSGPVFTVDLP